MMDQIAARAEPLTPRIDTTQYELKFALSADQAKAFLEVTSAWVAAKVYDQARPIAFARTTYLDSPDRRYLASSSEQVSRRLRIREYAAAPAPGAPAELTGLCYLEYKESVDGRRSKARLAMSTDDIAALLRNSNVDIVSERLAHLGDGSAARVLAQELVGRRLVPHLTTWYRRQSLVDADEEVRITLDTDIAFCAPLGFDGDHLLPPGPSMMARYANMCLLELKYENEPPRWLEEALRGLGNPDRLSKYAMGMRALEEGSSKP